MKSRVLEVWEDHVKRMWVVVETGPIVSNDSSHGPYCYHKILRLVAGKLAGTMTELPEFSENPWDKIFQRIA